jgi:hypothetical protein
MSIRIGLDFDNTIVNYDDVFTSVAKQLKLINKKWNGSKAQLRKYFIEKKKRKNLEKITRPCLW